MKPILFVTVAVLSLANFQRQEAPNPANAPVSVTLGERNNGGTVVFAEDGTARLKLGVNLANGYSWNLEGFSNQSIQLSGKPTLGGNTGKKPKPYQTFVFKALAPGSTPLTLRESKGSGPAPSDRIFTLTLHVVK
jgi:hypothetical protein